MGGTFATKQFAEKVEDINHGNHWVPYLYTVPVGSDFSSNMKVNKENSKKLRGNWRLLGMQSVMQQTCRLPFTLPK